MLLILERFILKTWPLTHKNTLKLLYSKYSLIVTQNNFIAYSVITSKRTEIKKTQIQQCNQLMDYHVNKAGMPINELLFLLNSGFLSLTIIGLCFKTITLCLQNETLFKKKIFLSITGWSNKRVLFQTAAYKLKVSCSINQLFKRRHCCYYVSLQ